MTEAEWLACTDPAQLYHSILARAGPRKLRLLGCALAGLTRLDERCRGPLEAAERHAESELPPADASAHQDALDDLKRAVPYGSEEAAAMTLLVGVLKDSFYGAEHAWYLDHPGVSGSDEKRATAAGLIRCVFGGMFRPPIWETPWPPPWRTATAAALAAGIYAERAFDRLPILADALEEAGCDDADILSHCRGPGPHARGCWVVDLVLERA